MPQKKRRKRRCSETNVRAVKILRPLKEKEGFHFYTGVDKPTGESAESLTIFSKKLKSVKLESLTFHLQRKDFQKWVKNTLGDSKLARRISRIRPLYDNTIREKMYTTIEHRIKELR